MPDRLVGIGHLLAEDVRQFTLTPMHGYLCKLHEYPDNANPACRRTGHYAANITPNQFPYVRNLVRNSASKRFPRPQLSGHR
jgi:hypothetical protein